MQRQSLHEDSDILQAMQNMMIDKNMLTPFIEYLMRLNEEPGVMQCLCDRLVPINENGDTVESIGDGVIGGRVFEDLELNADDFALKLVQPDDRYSRKKDKSNHEKIIYIIAPNVSVISDARQFIKIGVDIYENLTVENSVCSDAELLKQKKQMMDSFFVELIKRTLMTMEMMSDKSWIELVNAIQIKDNENTITRNNIENMLIDKMAILFSDKIYIAHYLKSKLSETRQHSNESNKTKKESNSFFPQLFLSRRAGKYAKDRGSLSEPASQQNSVETKQREYQRSYSGQ